MQSFDERNQLLETQMIENEQALLNAMRMAEEHGAVQHVIGLLPTKGQIIEINGLKYVVERVNDKKDKLRLRLLRPDDG